MLKHVQEPLPLPGSLRPDLPEVIDRVLLRAMAKELVEYQHENGTTQYYLLNAVGRGEALGVASIPNSWFPWYWPQWGGE